MAIRAVHVFACVCALVVSRLACEAAVCVPEFATQPAFDVGHNFGTSALADLDGDGNLDLLTGNAYLLGDGKGGFPERTALEGVPLGIYDVIAQDFDHDGRLDLVLGLHVGITVLVLFGREGDGGYLFEEPIDLLSVEGPWHLSLVDLDANGFADFVAAGAGPAGLAVHMNNGDGTFQPFVKVTPSGGIQPYVLAPGDFDGDGHVDIAGSGQGYTTIWFGDGTGKLAQAPVVTTATVEGAVIFAHRLCAADLDGDGRSEILGGGVAQQPGDPGFVFGYWGSSISAASGLPARTSFNLELPGAGRFLQVADLNGDGVLDVVAQGEKPGNTGNFIKVFYGVMDGGYTFEPAADLGTALSGHGSVLAVADVNKDGNLDIVLTTEDSDLGEVSFNDGRCALAEAARGDVNADSRLDIADAVAILSYLFAHGDLACAPAADTNSSGTLDIADAVYVLQYLFASGPPPAPGMVACAE